VNGHGAFTEEQLALSSLVANLKTLEAMMIEAGVDPLGANLLLLAALERGLNRVSDAFRYEFGSIEAPEPEPDEPLIPPILFPEF
jgi:hypothetical protein